MFGAPYDRSLGHIFLIRSIWLAYVYSCFIIW
jgi:hypothetical protein